MDSIISQAAPVDPDDYCSESRIEKFSEAYFSATDFNDEDEFTKYFSDYVSYCKKYDKSKNNFLDQELINFKERISNKSNNYKLSKIKKLLMRFIEFQILETLQKK